MCDQLFPHTLPLTNTPLQPDSLTMHTLYTENVHTKAPTPTPPHINSPNVSLPRLHTPQRFSGFHGIIECRSERYRVNDLNNLRAEQRHVDTVYARLDALREDTQTKLDHIRKTNVGSGHQNRSERDAFATVYEDQLIRLRNAEEGLCFGRIDTHEGTTTYIGRIGISDPNHTQLLMDWRAPASEPFYRATASHPENLVLRRHLATKNRQVISVEDDVLSLDHIDPTQRQHLRGEGALIASLDAHRTGRMSDIVETIQAEQDTIIRKPLPGVVVVQGGPGTGKTAVALHRAAYLLYQHRDTIARSGVLLVGPSPVFLKYIEQVLPSLGETGAVLLTPGQLYPGVETDTHDRATTSAIKGDLRMVKVLTRAVKNYQRLPAEDIQLTIGTTRVTLTPHMVKTARDKARRTGFSHNRAWDTFATTLMQDLAEKITVARAAQQSENYIAEVVDDVRLSRDARIAINSHWLPLTPEGVLDALFSKPHKLVSAAEGILTYKEMAHLRRPAGAHITVEDVPLLDELAELIGSPAKATPNNNHELDYAQDVVNMTGTAGLVSAQQLARRYADLNSGATLAERAQDDREWMYGHLVVDEAQELSPMQLRLLFGRVSHKSATLVGDLAQATDVDTKRTWHTVLDPHVDTFDLNELTVSYRTPGKIMAVANSVLREYFPALTVPTPVRVGSYDPVVTTTTHVADSAEQLPGIVGRELSDFGGKVAVIAHEEHREVIEAKLAGAGVDFGVGPAGIDHAVAVLTPFGAKGLEFDSVIIFEPAFIAPAGSLRGVGELYVALTRATSRLTVLTSKDSVLDPWL